jgi:acetoin utilization protein AcuC
LARRDSLANALNIPTQPLTGADRRVVVIADDAVGRYGFPEGHPFGVDRQAAFLREFRARGLHRRSVEGASRQATDAELLAFHTPRYVEFVRSRSVDGQGSLDAGDTPAFRGCFEVAAQVVGATLNAAQAIMSGAAARAFVPIAGLHHAARDAASGFCIFNDCGVLIERLRSEFGLHRIAYVDIDAHHGDGVYYAFESDPAVIFADLHEDGHYLFPGTGNADEAGKADATGTKLNIPLPPAADDAAFAEAWQGALAHLEARKPEFFILQCGADSLEGDPITHLRLTDASHAKAASDLCALADRLGHGRVLALGGGGYNHGNIARAWNAVVEALLL